MTKKDIKEYAGYIKSALKEADIEAPDKFCELLAEEMDDVLTRLELDIELGPHDAMGFLDSDYEYFDDYLINEWEQYQTYDEWKDNLEYRIGDVIGTRKFNDYSEELIDKVEKRATEIAGYLSGEAPSPALKFSYHNRDNFRANVYVGTPHSANVCFGDSDNIAQFLLEDDPIPLDPESGMGAIGWLMKTQGATIEDVKEKRGKFAKSLFEEIDDSNGYYGAPAFMVTLDVKNLEALKQGDSIKIDKNTSCGLVEFYNGAGGPLNIELEKDIVINMDLMHELQIEGAKNRYHTVDSIYGLNGSAWEHTVGIVDEKPMTPEPFTNIPEAAPKA